MAMVGILTKRHNASRKKFLSHLGDRINTSEASLTPSMLEAYQERRKLRYTITKPEC